jgi:hypothetical protein
VNLVVDALHLTSGREARRMSFQIESSPAASPMTKAAKASAKTLWLSEAPKYCQSGLPGPG